MSNLQQIILETLQGRVLNEDKKKVTIHKDTLVVDVRGKVDLSRKDLFVMPFKFGVIDGHFYIQNNHLNSLEGSPTTVTGGFYCKENKLTSIEGAPKEVGGNFECQENKLTSIEGAPKEVGGNFSCSYNRLKTLIGSPKKVGGFFYCQTNQLTSLEGAPKEVEGNFYCRLQKSDVEFKVVDVIEVSKVKGSIYV